MDDTFELNEEMPEASPEEAKDKITKDLQPESETQVKEKTELPQAKKDSVKKTGKTEAEKSLGYALQKEHHEEIFGLDRNIRRNRFLQ